MTQYKRGRSPRVRRALGKMAGTRPSRNIDLDKALARSSPSKAKAKTHQKHPDLGRRSARIDFATAPTGSTRSRAAASRMVKQTKRMTKGKK